MRRFIALMLILLLLLGTAACSVDGVLENTEEAAEATETPVSGDGVDRDAAPDTEDGTGQAEASASDAEEASSASDTDAITDGGDTQDEEAPAESDGQPELDYTSLSAGDCIEDAWPEAGVLLHITLDGPGAASINAAIDQAFTAYADDPMCIVYYQYFKNDPVLSILMVLDYQVDFKEYTPYNLDLSTGQEMTTDGLLALFDISREELAALELELLGQEFEYQYGGMESTFGDFYQEQYDRTIAAGNADTDRLWIGGDGQLYFVGRIYALFGAEVYEYIMGTGLTLE